MHILKVKVKPISSELNRLKLSELNRYIESKSKSTFLNALSQSQSQNILL